MIRLLTYEEGIEFTNCLAYTSTPDGNLIDKETRWNVTGSLIKKITLTEEDILCKDKTVVVPIKFKTFVDAMTICEQLGEKGDSKI